MIVSASAGIFPHGRLVAFECFKRDPTGGVWLELDTREVHQKREVYRLEDTWLGEVIKTPSFRASAGDQASLERA